MQILTPAELLLRGALSNLEAVRATGEHGSKQKEREMVAKNKLSVLALLGRQQHRPISRPEEASGVSICTFVLVKQVK